MIEAGACRGDGRLERRGPSAFVSSRGGGSWLGAVGKTAGVGRPGARTTHGPARGCGRWVRGAHSKVSLLALHALLERRERDTRLGRLIDQALAPAVSGCRGFTGPVPPPLWMSALCRAIRPHPAAYVKRASSGGARPPTPPVRCLPMGRTELPRLFMSPRGRAAVRAVSSACTTPPRSGGFHRLVNAPYLISLLFPCISPVQKRCGRFFHLPARTLVNYRG